MRNKNGRFIKGYKVPDEWKKEWKGKHKSPNTEFQKGKPPWNKGKINPYSQETIGRMRKSGSMKKLTYAHRKHISLSLPKGKYHWNWKGTTPLNIKLRHSLEWKEWRNKVFERDNFICQSCYFRGIELHPHHIVQLKDCLETNRMDLIFDVNNGITMCKSFHNDLHGLTKKGGLEIS